MNRKLISCVLLIIVILVGTIVALIFFLITQLANSPKEADYKREISTAFKENLSESQRNTVLDRLFKQAKKLHLSSAQMAEIYFDVGELYWLRAEADKALPNLKESANLFEKIGAARNRGQDGEAASLTAMCEHYANQPSSDALHYAQIGLAAKEKLFGAAAITTAHAEIAYGLACFDNRDLIQARLHLQKAEQIVDSAKPRTFRNPRPRFLRYWALGELAAVDATEHHLALAQDEFKQAIDYTDVCFGAGSAHAKLLLQSYGRALENAGYKKESEFYKSKLGL